MGGCQPEQLAPCYASFVREDASYVTGQGLTPTRQGAAAQKPSKGRAPAIGCYRCALVVNIPRRESLAGETPSLSTRIRTPVKWSRSSNWQLSLRACCQYPRGRNHWPERHPACPRKFGYPVPLLYALFDHSP